MIINEPINTKSVSWLQSGYEVSEMIREIDLRSELDMSEQIAKDRIIALIIHAIRKPGAQAIK